MVGHDTILRGLGARTDGAPPVILQRTDGDVIGSTLEQLTSEEPLAAVASTIANDRDAEKTLRLFQPVHRTFHLALVEVVCEQPGRPRLDPTKIESAGLVIRRVERRGLDREDLPQAWLTAGKKLRGWQHLGPAQADLDPDPARRRAITAGNPELARRALEAARLSDGAESVTPMFVAPPQVCGRAATTILFGLVPTASAEMSESSAPTIMPDDFEKGDGDGRTDDLRGIVPRFLRAATDKGLELGNLASKTFDMNASIFMTAKKAEAIQSADDRALLSEFLNCLKFLRASLDAFGSSPEAVAFCTLLSEMKVPYSKEEYDLGNGRPANDVLAEASLAMLVPELDGGTTTFTMPFQWPRISKDLASRIYEQVKKGLAARLSEAQPGVPRFDDPTARYQLRAFVRVKRDDGCPPVLVWSAPSEPFSIVAWYENGVVPPIQIRLPDITSKLVRALKPNVAFRIPKRLFNFLNENDPKDLMKGEGKEGTEFGLEWICGFNIAIIFVLAFIVMFIFLLILNIVFWWLPFIRICFPLPTFSRRKDT